MVELVPNARKQRELMPKDRTLLPHESDLFPSDKKQRELVPKSTLLVPVATKSPTAPAKLVR